MWATLTILKKIDQLYNGRVWWIGICNGAYNHCPCMIYMWVFYSIFWLGIIRVCFKVTVRVCVATPLWVKCEDETHTPKSGNLESSGTPKNSELEFKGQNTSHGGVIYTIEKVLKCRCPKWPRMNHLDICNTSYGRKKGRVAVWFPTTKSRESTRSRCVQVECDTSLKSSWRELQLWFRPRPDPSLTREDMDAQSHGSPNRDNFGTPLWESREKEPFGCKCGGEL
jgi:hypothetical protein